MSNSIELTITYEHSCHEAIETQLILFGCQAFLSKELEEVEREEQPTLSLKAYFDPQEYAGRRQAIERYLQSAAAGFCTRVIEPQDWENSWKAYFQPLEVAEGSIRIQPAWEPLSPQETAPYMAVILIDPGMAFGTGQHPTTILCLEALARLPLAGKSVLDVGTGSGILAIGARKMGANPVLAFDNDPLCEPICRENAALNQVEGIDFRTTTAEHISQVHDIVIANIIAGVHIEIMPHYRRLAGEYLILSGILREREADVRTALNLHGFRHAASTYRGDWCALCVEV